MKNGLESAGRALSLGLHPYRVTCRPAPDAMLIAQIYHPIEPLLLLKLDLSNDDACNPFKMNSTVASLRVQLDALAAYVASVVLADGEDRCQRA